MLRDVDASLGGHHGVSLSDLAILLELRDAPGQRLRRVELANRLGITPSGVARQLQPLERIGVVGRESHARDARLALVVLTDAGARIADERQATASSGRRPGAREALVAAAGARAARERCSPPPRPVGRRRTGPSRSSIVSFRRHFGDAFTCSWRKIFRPSRASMRRAPRPISRTIVPPLPIRICFWLSVSV